jgi:hypothetical protein
MSRTVCGTCWCPYDEFTGECACPPPIVRDDTALLRQALAQMEGNQYAVADTAPHMDVMAYNSTIAALRKRLEETK